MRKDALGLFWRDEPVIKIKKEKVKCVPPEPIWLRDDYLPGLDEAEVLAGVELLTDQELIWLAGKGEEMGFDIEVYRNYYLAGFRHRASGKVVFIESTPDGYLDTDKLEWILRNFTIVGFNSTEYDLPITSMALAGLSMFDMKEASNRIIQYQEPWRDVLKSYKVKCIEIDHMDLIEVAPLRASLKIYGGRMHTRQMQDLPFHPDINLSTDQKIITRYYCIAKDLPSTMLLRETLDEQIQLRIDMGKTYGQDLRSRSDAQIAEHVISAEVQNLNGGKRVGRPKIPPGTVYRYKVPSYLQYRSPLLQWALEVVRNSKFIVADHGSIDMPPEIGALELDINGSVYTMGIGGLHSTESKVSHVQDDQYEIYDFDVTSYYPRIILNQALYPYHMGPNFLRVYNRIVQTRVAAKQKGNKVEANSLKIVVNGSYGKLGSKWSNLYAPDLLIQVTLTGQLSLLLLIERLEMAGIHVISANTDGIVVKPHRSQTETMRAIVKQWERDTQFEMEESRYLALYSRDVNNYIAIKKKFDKVNKVWLDQPDGTKTKGAYANPWNSNDDKSMWLHKNPTNTICVEAVEALLTKGVPIVTTIRQCRDIRKFVSVRTVKGGAAKVWSRTEPPAHNSKEELVRMAGYQQWADGSWYPPNSGNLAVLTLDSAYEQACNSLTNPERVDFLGKAIRWYYGEGVTGNIVYALKGSKVPRSDGAKPLMDLPEQFPDDVDFAWYEREANKILKEIGYL